MGMTQMNQISQMEDKWLQIGMIRWRRQKYQINLMKKNKIKMELGFQIWQLDKIKTKVAKESVEKQSLIQLNATME